MIRRRLARSASCAVALVALLPLAAAAQPAPTPVAESRTLLLVDAAPTPQALEREARFFEELALAVDGVSVQRVDLGGDFGFLPLTEQLVRILPAAAERGAAAAVWIRESGAGRVLLHLVVLSEARELVRAVELDPGQGTESGLALAARELIREAHALNLGPATPAAVASPAAPPAAPVAAICPATEPPPSERPEWGLATLAVVNGGVAAYEGPSIQYGVALGVEWQPVDGLFTRLSFSGKAGPRDELGDGVVTGWGMELGLAAGYGWRLGPIALGPFLGLAGSRTALDVALGTGERRSYSWWGFRAALGLDLRVPLGRCAALVAEGAIGGLPSRSTFVRTSDGSEFLSTPYVDWSASLGAVVLLDGGK
jgi:hypothetical protein